MFSLQTQRVLRKATQSPLRICTACFQSTISYSPQIQSQQDRQETTPKRVRPQKKVIFSGIQPTGVPHLGNYLGALRQWVKLQDKKKREKTKLLFCIVDLHAITLKQDPDQLRQWRKEMFASLLAVGLSPKRSIIFAQSDVPAHSELMWILSSNASMGYLSRMTQWKSKLALPENASPLDPSPSNKAALKLGLFSYPVLQAADILLYGATHVPVGEDQAQHLEFTRELANGFNHLFTSDGKSIFTPPETILSPAKRVMSLTNPTKKMSKSDTDPKSRILITDTKEEIQSKINSARTDSIEGISYDPETRPGVSNLIDILYHMNEDAAESPERLVKDMVGENLSMKALKEKVAATIDENIRDVRDRYQEVMAWPEQKLVEKAQMGAQKAGSRAGLKMRTVKQAMGMTWPSVSKKEVETSTENEDL